MTLEFEKLTAKLDHMAQRAVRQEEKRRKRTGFTVTKLEEYATAWETIADALDTAHMKADQKLFRAARPLDENEPINSAIDCPPLPKQATIIATDGSQIMPDRHAPFYYYLLNVGGMVYFHGENGRLPETFSLPELEYLGDDPSQDISSADVSIRRDIKEIETLASKLREYQDQPAPRLGILDQRLLYWPIGTGGAANKIVEQWTQAMTTIRQTGSALCGFISRPGTNRVATMLDAITVKNEAEWKELGKRTEVTDSSLFQAVLTRAGQRSKVFADVSPANKGFREQDPENEVCFFYLNVGNSIARVDIPMWVAQEDHAVDYVHALLYNQCELLGGYPYIITRADEMAVVGKQDQAELNFMIELNMQRQGISAEMTAKQEGKDLARAGKTRHEGVGIRRI